jgi:hypothetical protein
MLDVFRSIAEPLHFVTPLTGINLTVQKQVLHASLGLAADLSCVCDQRIECLRETTLPLLATFFSRDAQCSLAQR